VANYDVQIAIAVKGQKELQRTRVETRLLQRSIDRLNKTVVKDSKKSLKSFDSLSKEVSRAKRAFQTAAIGTDDYRKAIRNVIKVEDQYNKELLKKNKIFEIEETAYKKGISFSQAKEQVLRKEIKAERELHKARLAKGKLTPAFGRGAASAVGSGIIGGGFPLLFGQGPISALGGAAGGIAGGALSAIPGMGQFGFALSIAGTAIGSAMEDLSEAMRKPEDNIENLIGKLGLVGTPTEKMAKELEKLGLKGSAAKLVMDKFNERFGDAPDILRENSEKMLEFKNKINELGTAITLFLGKALVPFIDSILSGMTQGNLLKSLKAQEGENFGKVQQSIVNQSHLEAQRLFKTTNQGKDIGKTYSQIFDERLTFNLKKAVGSPDVTSNLLTGTPQGGPPPTNPNQELIEKTKFNKEILPLQQALEIEQKRLTTSSEKLTLMQEQFELTNLENELELLKLDNKGTENDLHGDTIKKLEAQINLQEQVVNNAKALADPFREVSNIIAQDIGNGIRGLIKGTETLGNLLNNVVNKLIDGFINMAIFGNFGGTFERGGGGLLGAIFKANGGPVKKGGSYIVGERGPEMFSPGVSGTITPNHALGGSTTVIVNVDASGSSVEGNEEGGRELGRLISAAIQSELVQQKRPGGILA
tara:strand:+ start:2470 stop:4410 length:1941 start_codon:yes stop_codon:yes gene_type:complete